MTGALLWRGPGAQQRGEKRGVTERGEILHQHRESRIRKRGNTKKREWEPRVPLPQNRWQEQRVEYVGVK